MLTCIEVVKGVEKLYFNMHHLPPCRVTQCTHSKGHKHAGGTTVCVI